MNDEKLEALLKGNFQNEDIKADAKLIYKARQKAWQAEERRHKKESMEALVYVVILHIVWMAVLIGLSFMTKGINGAMSIGLRSLILSNILIIIGCIIAPHLKKLNEEGRR